MIQLSILSPKLAIGPFWVTFDSLGFWAGWRDSWECSWNQDGWIWGRVGKRG